MPLISNLSGIYGCVSIYVISIKIAAGTLIKINN